MIHRLIFLFAILSLAIAHCLNDTQATTIANAWLDVNARNDGQAAAALVTDGITVDDETINFDVGTCVLPPEGPYISGKQSLIANFAIRLGEAIVNGQKYIPLLISHDCVNIAIRWQGVATAKGNLPNKYVSPILCPFIADYMHLVPLWRANLFDGRGSTS